MKRDLDQPMLDLNGKAFSDKAILKTLCFMALSSPVEGDQAMPMDKKMKQYALLQKVNAGGVVDLTADDIAMIKDRAGKLPFSIIAIGRMCEMLEQDYKEPPAPALKAVKDSA